MNHLKLTSDYLLKYQKHAYTSKTCMHYIKHEKALTNDNENYNYWSVLVWSMMLSLYG